jgi:hypothetical protein
LRSLSIFVFLNRRGGKEMEIAMKKEVAIKECKKRSLQNFGSFFGSRFFDFTVDFL